MKYREKGNKNTFIAITYMLMLSTAGCGRSAVITEQTDVSQIISTENAIVSYLGPEGT